MNKELLKGLSSEQIEKAKHCKNNRELLELAKEEDIKLTEEQLEAVSGGCGFFAACPYCGSIWLESIGANSVKCHDCGQIFDSTLAK